MQGKIIGNISNVYKIKTESKVSKQEFSKKENNEIKRMDLGQFKTDNY